MDLLRFLIKLLLIVFVFLLLPGNHPVGGADVWPRGQTSFGSTAQPYHDLANLWRVWLPPEAEATFKKGRQGLPNHHVV